MLNLNQLGIQEKELLLSRIPKYVDPQKVHFKINAFFVHRNCTVFEECYREKMVSYYPMLPLLEKQVTFAEADYILYCHRYACCHDMSDIVLKELFEIDQHRKPGAEIIVVGKAANVEQLLNGSIKNISFYMSHFTEKLGKRFQVPIKENYFVWDDEYNWLAIWPVDGCLQKCKFCRRSYMEIPFESLSLDIVKQNLDFIKESNPEKLHNISLRAENLTEYGIDIYGRPMLHKLLDLLQSYEEIHSINIPIGLCIGEINSDILDALCRCSKLSEISLNLEAGTNRLLDLIGKPHHVEDAINVYDKLRSSNPNLYISSVFMLGLPTEGIEDIFELAKLIGICRPDHLRCNYYICAPKHPLAKLPQINKQVREYHLKILLKQLKSTLNRRCTIEYPSISKKSRKFQRKMNILEEINKYSPLPHHLRSNAVYIP